MLTFKNITCGLLAIGFVFSFVTVHAQAFKAGVKVGINTSFENKDALAQLPEAATDRDIINNLKDNNFGFHGGLYGRLSAGPLFLQPEVLLTSKKDLDIPLYLGFKLGPVRLQGGPMARMAFDANKGFPEVLEPQTFFGSTKFGARAGIGFDISKLSLDLVYETNLSALGDEVNLFGKTLSLNSGPPQIALSVGYAF